MVQADSVPADSNEKFNDPAEWSISQLISALVKRCEHAENTINALVDAMPSADELYGDAPQKWFDSLMEGRAYWETYDGPSTLAFRLSDVEKLTISNEAERADVSLNQVLPVGASNKEGGKS
jgi:hypothetical protein